MDKPQNPYPAHIESSYETDNQPKGIRVLPNREYLIWQECADAMEAYYKEQIQQMIKEIEAFGTHKEQSSVSVELVRSELEGDTRYNLFATKEWQSFKAKYGGK